MNVKEMSDEELALLAKSGGESATNELFGRYKNAVRAKARTFYLAGGDTEDLLQEGMIGLYRAVKDYNGESSFRSFAFLCIKRQIINAVKGAARKKHLPLNEYTALDLGEVSETGGLVSLSPEDILIGGESLEILNERINGALSALEREILGMYLAGLSYAQIAEKTGKDIKAIDNAIQRIRKKVIKIKAEN